MINCLNRTLIQICGSRSFTTVRTSGLLHLSGGRGSSSLSCRILGVLLTAPGDFGPDMMFGAQGFEAIPVQGMPMGNAPVYGQSQDSGPMQQQQQNQGQGMMNPDGTPMW